MLFFKEAEGAWKEVRKKAASERHFEKLKLWSSTADSLELFDIGPISLVTFHSVLWEIRHGICTIKNKLKYKFPSLVP